MGTTNGYETISQDTINSALAGVYGNAISVALPALQTVPSKVTASRLIVDGKIVAETTLASNLSYYFKKNFEEEYNKILISSAVRAATKFLITKQTKKEMDTHDENIGLIANIILTTLFTSAENADTRSWFTLPAEIREATVLLEEGKHEIKVQLLDSSNKVLDEQTFKDVQINKGRRTYLYLRSAI